MSWTARTQALSLASSQATTTCGWQGNFGPKYEQHVAQLQKALEDAQQRMQEMQKSEDELRWGGYGRIGYNNGTLQHAISDGLFGEMIRE